MREFPGKWPPKGGSLTLPARMYRGWPAAAAPRPFSMRMPPEPDSNVTPSARGTAHWLMLLPVQRHRGEPGHTRDRHKNLTNQPQNQPRPQTHAPDHNRTPGRTHASPHTTPLTRSSAVVVTVMATAPGRGSSYRYTPQECALCRSRPPRRPRCVSTGPVVVRLAEMAIERVGERERVPCASGGGGPTGKKYRIIP